MKKTICLILALLFLSACTAAPSVVPEEPVPAEPAETAPEPDETPVESSSPLSVSLCYESTDSFHPLTAKTSVNQQLLGLIYEGLFSVNPDGRAEGRLCTNYEVSSDGGTYTLYLRRGVTMHDGKLMTPQDVIASLKAAKKSSRYSYRLRHIRSILSVQNHAVTIELDTAYENLPLLLDVPIMREDDIEGTSPAGTGPYTHSGKRLNRFSDYWQGSDAVYYGKFIRLYRASSTSEICAAFTDSKITLAVVDPNGANGPTYHSVSDLYAQPTYQLQYLGFNLDSDMFKSDILRSAISFIIDRDSLVAELCSSFASPAVLPCDPASRNYDRVLAQRFSYDPDKYIARLEAAKLFDFNGDGVLDTFPDDPKTEARGTLVVQAGYPERLRMAQRISDELQGHGIELNIKALNSSEYRRALRNGNYDLYLGETALPPDGDLSAFFDPVSSLCLAGMENEEILSLCNLALENAGNFYTLYEAVLSQGLLCPIAVKQYAVYVQTGLDLDLMPALGNVYYAPVTEES